MPGPDPHGADLALLREAALGAGEIAKRHFQNKPKTWDKGDGQGPVTEADLEVNEYLHGLLLRERPDYGWLSEESDWQGDAKRTQTDATFIVDPIDGTRAFIDGQPSFAHALAVVRAGRPVAGLVHLPMLGLTYAATLGGGATVNDEPIAASTRTNPDGATVLAARPVFDPQHWPGGMPDLRRHFRPSLAWRLALVGQGRFDAMMTIRNAWDWDIAGASLIASEAGARITNRFGHELRFNGPEAMNAGIVAAPGKIHERLIAGLNAPRTSHPLPNLRGDLS